MRRHDHGAGLSRRPIPCGDLMHWPRLDGIGLVALMRARPLPA